MQVGEQFCRAALCEPARAVRDVGVEKGADPRPGGLQRPLPERMNGVGEAPDLATRMLEPPLGDSRSRVLGAEELDVVADLLDGGAAERSEVVVDTPERTGGRRGEEVGCVAARGDQRDDRLQRDPVEAAAERAQPGQVQRGGRGIAQCDQ